MNDNFVFFSFFFSIEKEVSKTESLPKACSSRNLDSRGVSVILFLMHSQCSACQSSLYTTDRFAILCVVQTRKNTNSFKKTIRTNKKEKKKKNKRTAIYFLRYEITFEVFAIYDLHRSYNKFQIHIFTATGFHPK